MNLLIVDDHPINCKLLRMQLEVEGHRVFVATNGVEALEILDRESVDGVVSDILMPGMDGFQLCLEIRKRKNLARLPFVFYTGTFKSPQDREFARSVGADQYLTKPSTAREILGALEHAMQTTRDRIAVSAARHDATYVLKQYNESLVRKLEEQKHELEGKNFELEEVLKNLQIAHDGKQESEQRFRAIFDHAGVGISMRPAHDRNLPWVQVNDHFCKLLGYTRDELLKLGPADITPAEGQANAIGDNQRLLNSDIAGYSREKQLIRKDGRRIWVLLTVASLPGPDGRPEKFIATYQGISERKEAEEKINRLNRVYAVLSGINTLIVHVTDRQELFNGACRIAIEHGNFGMTWIGKFDPATQDVTPIAWAGESAEMFSREQSSAREDSPGGKGPVGRSIRERRPVFNNNITDVGRPRVAEMVRLGLRSQITLPLLEDQVIVGTLTMYARERDFFDEEEVRLLAELAGDISFALENISKQQKFDKLFRISAISSGINSAIVHIRERQALLEEACRIAVEHGKFGIAWIGDFNPATLDVTPVAWAGLGAEAYLGSTKSTVRGDLPQGQGAVGRAIRELRPVFSNDISAEPGVGNVRRAEALQRGYRSLIVLPLIVEGAAAGNLSLFTKEIGFFDDEEVKLLAELAGNISFALENISRQQKIEKLSRIQAVLGEINAAITRVRSRQELLDAACSIAVEKAGFPLAWIGMLNAATQDLKPAAMAGTVLDYGKLLAPSIRADIPAGQGTSGRAFREKKPVVDNDMAANQGVGVERKEGFERGIRAALSLPLLVEGAPVGVMGLYANEKDYFDAEEISLLTEVASDISSALEHMARQEKLDKLSRIRAISSAINAAIVHARNRQELFEEACRIAVERGQLGFAWIGSLDPATLDITPVAWAGEGSEAMQTTRSTARDDPPLGQGPVSRAVRERRAVCNNDILLQSFGSPRRDAVLELGFRSMIALPLIEGDKVAGTLTLYAKEPAFFDEAEIALLTELAGNVSFALDHMARQQKLDYFAYYDALTGLANRALFLERAAQSIRSAAGGGHKLALILIDLERFKNINDSLGRPVGDELLGQVAVWMTQNLGDVSRLARVDADHFAVLLPELAQERDVARLIEKSMAAFMAHPFQLRDAVFRIAAKAGVALFPDDGADADTLFRNAEAALKKAKSSGERYLFHTKKMTEAVATKLTLENQLREALDKGEFVLHYQPKINLASGAVCGLEALIRWQKPGGDLVAPGVFIPLLEETGLILGVGKWALSKALAQHREWTARGIAAPRIAVNVSAIQLQQKDFSDVVIGTLQAQGGNPDALELEVTESLLMQDVQESIRTLSILRALGIHIAMDDFGTGYSSLSYLARLPINSLKIDRSFITEMAKSPQDMGIVTTIIALAHSMNLKVVAEGVETEEQAQLLKLLKCDEVQGYLYSKPVPADVFETKFLAAPPAGMTKQVELTATAGGIDQPRTLDIIL